MQLCRFVLRDDPDTSRSGIFHEQRIYETDGQKALGIHELSKIILLPPVSAPPTLRVVDVVDHAFRYEYRNPHSLMGPLAEMDFPAHVQTLGLDLRAAVILKDKGEAIERGEASDFILGYCLYIGFTDERRSGAAAYDLPYGLGPFITTPDLVIEEGAEVFKSKFTFKLNGDTLAEEEQTHPLFELMLMETSRGLPLLPSDVVAGPAWPVELTRSIQPGDTLQFGSDKIGMLTLKVV